MIIYYESIKVFVSYWDILNFGFEVNKHKHKEKKSSSWEMLHGNYRVSQKKWHSGKQAITRSIFGLFAFPRRVLENSGSEDFKTDLTFQNWSENTGDIGS